MVYVDRKRKINGACYPSLLATFGGLRVIQLRQEKCLGDPLWGFYRENTLMDVQVNSHGKKKEK